LQSATGVLNFEIGAAVDMPEKLSIDAKGVTLASRESFLANDTDMKLTQSGIFPFESFLLHWTEDCSTCLVGDSLLVVSLRFGGKGGFGLFEGDNDNGSAGSSL